MCRTLLMDDKDGTIYTCGAVRVCVLETALWQRPYEFIIEKMREGARAVCCDRSSSSSVGRFFRRSTSGPPRTGWDLRVNLERIGRLLITTDVGVGFAMGRERERGRRKRSDNGGGLGW